MTVPCFAAVALAIFYIIIDVGFYGASGYSVAALMPLVGILLTAGGGWHQVGQGSYRGHSIAGSPARLINIIMWILLLTPLFFITADWLG